MNTPELLIFDLDGTLIDSRLDLIRCVNATLLQCNLQPLPGDRIASFIGDGAATLVERSLLAAGGEPSRSHSEALTYFLAYYREHLLDHTHVYPGVLETLQKLHQAPDAPLLAVLTNKPVHPSHRICDALQLTPYFFANFGGNSLPTKKPEPAGLLAIWQQAEAIRGKAIPSEQVVLIGDSEVDVRTARNARVLSWGCTWGFATEKMLAESPDALAYSPSDWLSLFNQGRVPC